MLQTDRDSSHHVVLVSFAFVTACLQDDIYSSRLILLPIQMMDTLGCNRNQLASPANKELEQNCISKRDIFIAWSTVIECQLILSFIHFLDLFSRDISQQTPSVCLKAESLSQGWQTYGQWFVNVLTKKPPNTSSAKAKAQNGFYVALFEQKFQSASK